jgi:ankyrin repeat protein
MWISELGTDLELLGVNVKLLVYPHELPGRYLGYHDYMKEALMHVKGHDPNRIHFHVQISLRSSSKHHLLCPVSVLFVIGTNLPMESLPSAIAECLATNFGIASTGIDYDQVYVDGTTLAVLAPALVAKKVLILQQIRQASGGLGLGSSNKYGVNATTLSIIFEDRRIDTIPRPDLEGTWRPNSMGGNLLHFAMVHQQNNGILMKILQRIQETGLDLDEQDMFGFTPFHYAVLSGRMSRIDAMLRAGANVSIRTRTGYQDDARRMVMRYGCKERILRLFFPSSSEIEQFFEVEEDPAWHLLLSLHLGRRDLIDRSLSFASMRGGIATAAKRADAIFPVYVAALRSGHQNLKLLLSMPEIRESVDIDASIPKLREFGTAGGNVLHYAAQQNHVPAIKLLLAHSADVGKRDDLGRTPLILACRFARAVPCVPLLLERMSGKPELLNMGDYRARETALHWTTTWRKKHENTLLLFLATSGVNVLAEDKDTWTVFTWANRNKHRQWYRICDGSEIIKSYADKHGITIPQ